MEYGCIGEKLTHSFSKDIHSLIADYDYEIKEISKDNLDSFMRKGNFKAINVTIPYKEKVIPYLYYVDDFAKEIGSVNTIVNKNGKLYGYNTDFFGMKSLIERIGVKLEDKSVLILGTGGTSKTAVSVAKNMNARSITCVSRSKKENAITYEEAYQCYNDAEIIINTTPSGMFPKIDEQPIDLTKFNKLRGVIDCVYNPIKTSLIISATDKGVKAEGGLYMLVAQAVFASEIFLDKKYDSSLIDKVYKKILRQKQNIVLTGMPSSGKTTIGKILSKNLNKEFVDVDDEIIKIISMDIKSYFDKYGEVSFREVESEVVKQVSNRTGLVIATGGGAVLNYNNIIRLKQNGRIYFIDKPIEMLNPTSDRPTASDKESIKKRYSERYNIYCNTADKTINADCSDIEVSDKIENDFNE